MKSKAMRIALKPLCSEQKQNSQASFENCLGNTANWLANLRRNQPHKELCAGGKQARNFAC